MQKHQQKCVIQVLPALNSGGVERGTLEISEYLVKKGWRSVVISSCLLYTSPSPRDVEESRMPSSA